MRRPWTSHTTSIQSMAPRPFSRREQWGVRFGACVWPGIGFGPKEVVDSGQLAGWADGMKEEEGEEEEAGEHLNACLFDACRCLAALRSWMTGVFMRSWMTGVFMRPSRRKNC